MEEEVKNARAKLAERFANNNTQIGGKGRCELGSLIYIVCRNPEKNQEEAHQHHKCE
jgi:hypothetical protein